MEKKRQKTSPDSPEARLPRSLAEAIAFLHANTNASVIEEVKATAFENLIKFHRDLGMQVRNVLGMWGRNPVLMSSLPEEKRWPDDAAMYVIEAWWKHMHDRSNS